ncbi:MAG: hypothetical protein R2764_06350 [Bacteroidales bacterium]
MIEFVKNIVFCIILILLLGLIIESSCSGYGVKSDQIEEVINTIDSISQERASIAFIPGKTIVSVTAAFEVVFKFINLKTDRKI